MKPTPQEIDEEWGTREEDRAEQRYEGKLFRHPDCRDPGHPGCEDCREGEEA